MRLGFDLLTSVAERIGTEAFFPGMMAAALQFAPSDDSQVIFYPAAGTPSYLNDEHTPPLLRALYAKYCPYDPFFRDWRRRRHAGVRTLKEVQPPGYDEGGYSSGFYDQTGYEDEVGLMFPALIGSAVGVFIQRAGVYSQDDIEGFNRLFPALRRLHAAHRRQLFASVASGWDRRGGAALAIVERSGRTVFASEALRETPGGDRAVSDALDQSAGAACVVAAATRLGSALVAPIGSFPYAPEGRLVVLGPGQARDRSVEEALESFGSGILSRRESQIARLVFAGYGGCHIADALGISEGTVKNIRKRLYYKMDVTSERELFALFLEHLRTLAAARRRHH